MGRVFVHDSGWDTGPGSGYEIVREKKLGEQLGDPIPNNRGKMSLLWSQRGCRCVGIHPCYSRPDKSTLWTRETRGKKVYFPL